MNKLGPSRICRICGKDIRRLWGEALLVRLRVELNRMMANGMCDDCQNARLAAAIEYENALAEIRLVMDLGGSWSRRRPPTVHPALRYARFRRDKAEAQCVALKMWPAARPAREEKK